MASRRWDAYKSLGITTRDSDTATCFGTNRYGKRCRWDIEHISFQQIRTLLDRMERRPPKDSLSSLDQLARLCLSCEYHPSQRGQVISGWRTSIAEAQRDYEKGVALKAKIAELEAGSGSQQPRQDLHDEIARLRYQIALEQDARSSMEAELNQRISQSNNLQQRLYEETCKVRNAMSERDRFLQQMALSESNLTQWKAKCSQAEEALQTQTSRATNLQRVAANADYYRDISEERSQQISDLELTLEEEKLKVAKESRKFSKETTARIELQATNATIHSDLQEISQQRDHLTIELTIERDRNSRILRESNQTRQDLATIKSELIDAQANIEALQADNDRLRLSTSENEQQSSMSIAGLRQDLSETQQSLSSIQQVLVAKEKALSEMTENCQSLRKDMDYHKAVTTAAQEADVATITKLRQDLTSAEDKISVAHHALKECQGELSELRTSTEDSEQQHSALIERLTGRFELYRIRPFRAFFMAIMQTFGRRPMAFLEGLRVARFSKVTRSAASGVEPVDK